MSSRSRTDGALSRELAVTLVSNGAGGTPLRLAMLFGSRARGRARADSDVDLAVLAGRRLRSEEIVALVRDVASHVGRAVDVVDLFDLPQPVTAEALGGVRVLGDEATFADTVARNAAMYEDFGRLRERVLAARRRAWLDG